MALLDYNEIKERKYIVYEGEPYEVVEAHVARKQQRKPQNQTKLKSLVSGKVVAVAFHAQDTALEAEIAQRDAKYLYMNRGEYWFCDPTDPKNRFQISEAVLEGKSKWLKPDTIVKTMVFEYKDEEKVIGIKLPIKITLEVKDAPPGNKGNTSSGGDKVVVLETGTNLTVPLFINAGDRVVINTDTGEYVERYTEK
jgi:elongation factor P